MNSDHLPQSSPALLTGSAPADLIGLLSDVRTVMAEILFALNKSTTPPEHAAIQSALQKVVNALQVAGEPGLASVLHAIAQVHDRRDLHDGTHIDVIKIACKAILRYLDALDERLAPHPLRLFGVYKKLLAVLGQKRIHPVDLAFAGRIDATDLTFSSDATEVPAADDIAACRIEVERGLRAYSPAPPVPPAPEADAGTAYLQQLAELLAMVANTYRDKPDNFWHVLEVAVAVLASAQIEIDQYAQKFIGQVNLQLRRLASGVVGSDPRVLREALFFIALAPVATATTSATAIKQAIGLPDLQQADYQESADADADADVNDQTPFASNVENQAAVAAAEMAQTVDVLKSSEIAAEATEPAPEQYREEQIDIELLDTFLTEAEEIVATIGRTLPASRKDRENMAHITTLRRGFHTLKGSSRMVGLSRLGEGAMAVEGFLNTWLTEAASGSDADYILLGYASQEIADWVGEIRAQGKSLRSPDELIAAVTNARRSHDDGKDGARCTATAGPVDSPEPEMMRIGSMIMPVRLHQIYCDESRILLEVIFSQLQQWQREPLAVIAPALLRATHSLKSSAASVQFTMLQTVAQPLDELIQFVENYPALLDAEVCAVLLPLVSQLQSMQQMFAAAQMPSARDDLRLQLEDLLRQLEARHEQTAAVAKVAELADIHADDIDPELLEVFLEEGRDLLPQIGASLHQLQKSPDDAALIRYVLRPLHTIKGSARMAGAMRLGQHMHDLESRISEMVRGDTPSAAQIDDLLARYDRGLQLFEALQSAPTSAAASALPDETAGSAGASSAVESIVLTVPDSDAGKNVSNAPLVRIRAGILDSLLNQAGEISISRSGLESDVDILRQHLADLGGNVARLSTQLREVEIQAEIQIAASNQRQPHNQHFDPLEFDRFTHLQELTRMLAESVNDVSSLQKNLLETVDHTQNALVQQARLTRGMQRELMRARMVQFRDVEERLHRLVRQMAKETGKDLALEITGNTVELDRSILEKMVGPFEHLLRNAAAHGIEPAQQRRAAGKDAVGRLLLEVRQEGNEVMIRLSDDGQGLDLVRIREKAVRLGLVDAALQLSDAELSGIIFQPGFTTSADVTAIAGRGVGMDVVRSEVASLGGRISIDSVAGKGATFIIRLPLSLAVTQVVLLELGGQIYAIPSLLVEQVLQLKSAEQARVFQEGSLDWQGRKLPVHYLSALLGEDNGVPQQQTLPMLVVKSGHDFLAILVDRIIGNREVVTKNIGPQLAHMVGVVGATVLGSGGIVLILNPIQLAQHQGHQKMLRKLDETMTNDAGGEQTIMVVDDSLTVRRVMQRLLTREGYHVVLATDGVDALQQLRDIRPDIVLLDIEMPRMDGFDLARHIRDMPGIATLPIIMITSRTAAKHRERAMELGVNAYLGKPYQDEELLKLIHGLIGEHEGGVRPAYMIDEVLFAPAEPAQSDASQPPDLDV